MFPPARPGSRQDASAHSTQDRRLNGQRNAQPAFVSSPSPDLWNDHVVDHPFMSQLASTHQSQPAHHDTTASVFSGNPNFSNDTTTHLVPQMPFAFIIEPSLQPSQHVPATDEPQRSESNTQPHRPRRKQQNPRHPQYTAAQWDDHRPKIKDLYIDQNSSLEQTMEIMSE
ncbi:hypothetical protein K440DRAFT_663588 [Wilcoxina mikolae CBS 423.85]|nr:hypothetical protein K440DRAFT_663588 [Wilcoxina mikolae CBS 423.85]